MAMQHAGGYAPLLSLRDYLTTPAFTGAVAFGVDGKYLSLSADAQWTQPIGVGSTLILTGNPVTSSPGLSAAITLSKETNESAADFAIAFDGGLKISSGVPTLGARGTPHRQREPCRHCTKSNEGGMSRCVRGGTRRCAPCDEARVC